MTGLMKFVDICVANEEDAADVFGISAADSNIAQGSLNRQGYQEVAAKLLEKFSLKKVGITLRESISASDNNWSGMLYDGKSFYFSANYPVHIVDRVGGGDSFTAGLIYADLNGLSAQQGLDFAVAASCLKLSIEGDLNHMGIDEVKKLAQGDASGRVQR